MTNKKRRLFILEGVDGAGKSTLAEKLAAIHGAKLIHRGRIPEGRTFRQEYVDDPREALEHSDVVMDRSYLSEWVYGAVFRRQSNQSMDDLSALLDLHNDPSIDIVRLYLYAPEQVLAERLEARGDETVRIPDLPGLLARYSAAVRGHSWVTWDTQFPMPPHVAVHLGLKAPLRFFEDDRAIPALSGGSVSSQETWKRSRTTAYATGWEEGFVAGYEEHRRDALAASLQATAAAIDVEALLLGGTA